MTDAYAGLAGDTTGTGEHNRQDFAMRRVLDGVWTSGPCVVVAIRGDRVDIRPSVGQLDGSGKGVPHGTIHNVPVWQYQAGGSAVVLRPAVGDHGWALYAHSDISSVKANNGKPSNPGSLRKHDPSDAMYMGGVFGSAPTQTITMSDADGIVITSDKPVRINAPELNVSGKVTSGTGSTFGGRAFDTHTHKGVTAGTATSGPPV
jgi:hypothetical protein